MRTPLIALCIAVAPLVGRAEEMPGIDLSQPGQPPPQQPPGEAKPGDAGELPPIDLSKPQQPPPAENPPAQAKEGQPPPAPFSEKDVALGDKVKAVQRKGFMKAHRFELSPRFSVTVNDPYYLKYGAGLRLAYSFEDSFAVALRGTYFQPYRLNSVREGKLAFRSQLLSSQLYGRVVLDGVWSPIYGKFSFLRQNIIHFDLYLSAGGGLVWTATSLAPRNEGPHLAADLGTGLRFYPTEWMAIELGLDCTLYPDQPSKSVPGTIQRVFVTNLGFSFFLPTRFNYKYQ